MGRDEEGQNSRKSKGSISTVWIGVVLLIMAASIFYAPFFITAYTDQSFLHSGQIGDTIGGTTAPLIGFFAVVATFAAFWVQYQANQQQRRDIALERFESRFYEMLRIHNQNVIDINISGKHKGRKAFVRMYQEFRALYKICKSSHDLIDSARPFNKKMKYDERKVTKLAYILFFFGAGEVSDKGSSYYTYDFDSELLEQIFKEIEKCQNKYSSKINNDWEKFEINLFNEGLWEFELDYFPFDGHVAKLGHYFRHLYQTIKLATTHKIFEKSISEYEERYEYVKTLRVQLSNHEQAMIYYNSFFTAGNVWWGDETIEVKNKDGEHLSYFLDYGMIKNLPFNLTDGIGPDPVHEFLSRLLKRGYNDETEKSKSLLIERMKELFEWNIDKKVETFYE